MAYTPSLYDCEYKGKCPCCNYEYDYEFGDDVYKTIPLEEREQFVLNNSRKVTKGDEPFIDIKHINEFGSLNHFNTLNGDKHIWLFGCPKCKSVFFDFTHI